MALYAALIYEDEAKWQEDTPEANAGYAAHSAFGEKYAASLQGGKALQPTSTATSIRRDADGATVVTDGPWAESKEALGGFYLIEADDLDAALKIAAEVPHPFGGIEVRPIWDVG